MGPWWWNRVPSTCSLPWSATVGAVGSNMDPILYRHRVSRGGTQMGATGPNVLR